MREARLPRPTKAERLARYDRRERIFRVAAPILAEKRRDLARRRVARWRDWHPDKEMTEAPGHIRAMAKEN